MQLHLQKRLEQLQDIDLPLDVSCLQNHELRVEVKDGKTLKLTVSSPEACKELILSSLLRQADSLHTL